MDVRYPDPVSSMDCTESVALAPAKANGASSPSVRATLFTVVALFNEDFDVVAESGHGLVDGVVDNLVDQMVQAYDAGGTDVIPKPPKASTNSSFPLRTAPPTSSRLSTTAKYAWLMLCNKDKHSLPSCPH